MESSLRERFARLRPIRVIDRVPSGSPAAFVLRLPAERASPRSIDATFTLARRGLALLHAKHMIERVLRDGRAVVELPMVEDKDVVTGELVAAGFTVTLRQARTAGDEARLLRGEKLPFKRAA